MKRTFRRMLSLFLSALLLSTMLCGALTTTVSAAIVKGDLNHDGHMNSADARTFLVMVAMSTELTMAQKAVADVNNDSLYTTSDIRAMLDVISSGGELSKATRAIWIPYMEVNTLLSSSDPATARAAIEACMDDCYARGANTVYFHVRANSDAYYNSSVYQLHSRAAKLVANGFDPLECAIELAHERGMELHAWVNPYRIGSSASYAQVDATFVYSSRYYYVPSDAQVHDLVVAGVRELVENYDIDGVQFDDYFYPTGSVSSSTAADFETADYTAYKNAGGTMSIGDWRRYHVNQLIASCYAVCHSRSGCVFGISPSYDFESNYDEMYADAATWAKYEGYVDYLCPQLYIGFDHAYAPFETALAAWNDLERHDSLQLIAGLALYKTGLLEDTWAGTKGKYEWLNNDDVMERQIACAKALDWNGVALYSHQSFEVGSDRNATVANADMTSACEAWLTFQ